MSDEKKAGFAILDGMRDKLILHAIQLAQENAAKLSADGMTDSQEERIAITVLLAAANRIALNHRVTQASFFCRHLRTIADRVEEWTHRVH